MRFSKLCFFVLVFVSSVLAQTNNNGLVSVASKPGQSGLATLAAVTGSINTTETQIVSASIAANTIVTGTTYRIQMYGTCTASAAQASNPRIRFGPLGTNADQSLGALTTTAATAGSNTPFFVEFVLTFQSTTVAELTGRFVNTGSGTGQGCFGTNSADTVVMPPVNTTGLTTTSTEILQLTYSSTATTVTAIIQTAIIEQVK